MSNSAGSFCFPTLAPYLCKLVSPNNWSRWCKASRWGVSWARCWKPVRHTVDRKKGIAPTWGAFPTSAHVVGWLCLFSGAMSCSGGKQRSFTLNLAGQFVAWNNSLRCSKLYLEMDISSLEPWETIKHLFDFLSGFAVCKSFIPAPAPLSQLSQFVFFC